MQTKRRINALARDRAAQFDESPLHNRVHEQVKGSHDTDDDLSRLVELAEGCYQFSADYRDGLDDPVGSAAFGAAEDLDAQIDAVADEQVARACTVIATEAQEWTDHYDAETLAAARHEAREWLQANHEAAKRAGVWEVVTA